MLVPYLNLPTIVRERAVGLGHLEDVLTLLDGSAQAVGSVEDLVGETLGHGLLLASAGEVDDPADTQSGGTTGVDLHRDLIGSATDTLGLNLERGLDVVHSLLEGSESVTTLGLLGNDLESGVNDALSGGLLAVKKDLVDELSPRRLL